MATGEPEDWKSRFKCVADGATALRAQLREAIEREGEQRRRRIEAERRLRNLEVLAEVRRDRLQLAMSEASFRPIVSDAIKDAIGMTPAEAQGRQAR